MRARTLRVGSEPIERALGSVLASDARGERGPVVLRKGTRLKDEHRAQLAALRGATLHLVELDEGELAQDEVARRLARAIAGPGVLVDQPRQGQVRLRAAVRGLLRVRAEAVAAVNRLSPLLCFTLAGGQVVVEGDEVAGTKSAALATPERTLAQAEAAVAREAPVLEIAPFQRRRIGVLVTDRLEPKSRALVVEAIRRKIAWFGSELLAVSDVTHERDAVAQALRDFLGEGADLLLVSGANALDPLDPALMALTSLGGGVERAGVPAHPGSMVWVGEIASVSVLGIATCAGFGKNTSLDLLLARTLAGEEAARAADELGHGGLVEGPSAAAWFPPYQRVVNVTRIEEPAEA